MQSVRLVAAVAELGSLGVVFAMSVDHLQGKKVRAEYRTARRTHYVGIGTLRVLPTGVDAAFPFRSRVGEHEHVFHLTEQQIKRLVPVVHPDYDFQFSGTLDREEGLSEDDGTWTRLPKTITFDDAPPKA